MPRSSSGRTESASKRSWGTQTLSGKTSLLWWSTQASEGLLREISCERRGLALLADYGVVSASHDMTLKVWDFQGSIVSDLIGHTAIVYSAATSPSGLVASASEDNTARVWSPDGSCLATIPHPGPSHRSSRCATHITQTSRPASETVTTVQGVCGTLHSCWTMT